MSPKISPPVRVGAGLAVVALHAVVIAAVLNAKPVPLQASEPETVQVRFIELAPQVQLAQALPAPTPMPPAPSVVAEPPKAEPPPKPVLPKPVPEPPKPKPKPEPKLKPKPQPKPQPKHIPVKKVEPAPVVEPVALIESAPSAVPSALATAPAPPAGNPNASASRSAAPDKPVSDTPPLVGQIDYLGAPPKPVYPRHSLRLGEEGRVLIKVLVNPRGTVDRADLERSSGFGRLDEAALGAARQGRFKPYTVNGLARSAYVIIPFEFTARN